ncbi:MAG TPA: R.Pab1 family restriction endonuclease [Verrucomicrobiae bacterium]|nr:R.Pab1 family restriction endonuclease [Verrucomicrobiae bacterium]
MKKIVWILALVGFVMNAFCADVDYKQVLIFTNGDAVRVRLPLTDVTGKVRMKAREKGGFGIPIAPRKTALNGDDYLEWQIGYDTTTTNSPSVVPEIRFQSNGETKYGHELSKIILESVRMGILSTNDLKHEIEALEKVPPNGFEEDQPVQIEIATNTTADGFQRAVEELPLFTKTTQHGWVQIQLKQKQRAVGYQAMVYVCLPMNQVLDMNGNLRVAGRAKSKETVYYDFNRDNAAFILDIIQAFGIASPQHNEDLQKILERILERN